MAYDYQQLVDHVREVTHRSDLSNELFARWDDEVTQQLQNDVQVNRLLVVEPFTPLINPTFIGSPFAQVVSIQGTQGGANYKLQPTSREQVDAYLSTTGASYFYNAVGNAIRIAPFNSEQFTVTYREPIEVLRTSTTQTVLRSWPQLYTAAFLQKAYEFLRDFEAADRYKLLYDQQVQAVNDREMEIAALENSQMSGASNYQSLQGER